MNAATAIHQKSSRATIDLRDLIVGARNEDGTMRELPHPDAAPLPSIASLPDLDSGLELLVDQLIGLQPVDQVVNLKSLTTDPVSGAMFQEREPGKQPKLASYTPSAITQLCWFWSAAMKQAMARSPGANLLWYAPAARRAMVDDVRSRIKNDREVTVRLLTFSKPIIRAFCSETHGLDTADLRAVALRLRETARQRGGCSDARMWGSWAWDTARMTVYFGEDRRGVRAVANLALSETKAHGWFANGGVHVQGVTYWGWTPAENAHGRHVGNRVADRMVAAIWAASDMREQIITALDRAKHLTLTATEQGRVLRDFDVPNELPESERPITRTLFDLIDRLFRLENTSTDMGYLTRQQLREGLGNLLKAICEGGIEAVAP